MERRTCDIIMTLKHPQEITLFRCVTKYLSEECDYPMEDYTEEMIFKVVKDAVVDYMRTSTEPHVLMYSYFDILRRWSSVSSEYSDNLGCSIGLYSWLAALQSIQVRECSKAKIYYYINGFTKELLEQSEIDLHLEGELV